MDVASVDGRPGVTTRPARRPAAGYGDDMTTETPTTSAGLPTTATGAAMPPAPEPPPWTRCLTLREIEAAGAELLPKGPRAYYEGGAADEVTLRDNQAAFEQWRIVPRMMVPNAERDQSVEVLGRRWPSPVAIAPMALQRLGHPDGEVAVARAAGARGLTYILSTCASAGFEEVCGTGADTWFQLYLLSDRPRSRALLDQAAAAGCEAIVLTMDTPMTGPSRTGYPGRLQGPRRCPVRAHPALVQPARGELAGRPDPVELLLGRRGVGAREHDAARPGQGRAAPG